MISSVDIAVKVSAAGCCCTPENKIKACSDQGLFLHPIKRTHENGNDVFGCKRPPLAANNPVDGAGRTTELKSRAASGNGMAMVAGKRCMARSLLP